MENEKLYEEQYRLGEKYLMEGDYEKAYNQFIELDKLDVDYTMNARFRLGQMYYYGSYVERDWEKAFNYFTNTIHPEAIYFLGLMYYNGDYVEKDYQKAYECFERLEGHSINAEYMIGKMYCYGYYVEKNIEKARKIFNWLVEKHQDKRAKHMLEMIKYFEDGTIPSDRNILLIFRKEI